MQTIVITIARWFHGLAFALWLGGLIAIGAIVAPTAFHAVRSSPLLSGQAMAQNTLAGAVVGNSLRVFNVVSVVCGILLVITNSIMYACGPRAASLRRLAWAEMGVIVILLASTLYLMYGLFPALDTAQHIGNMALFDALHHRYERISWIQMPGLLLALLLTAMRNSWLDIRSMKLAPELRSGQE